MKQYFAYIRVSTTRQGERGSSLQEQRDAISAFAQRNNLTIIEWFEEQETAAKHGRRIFTRMLSMLKQGKAHGLIVHKIDRSARNLRDWADLGDLMDQGIEVHFAHDSIDLNSRGGRLSADIQAVVAADYIRNLRDEIRKGFYGRLKQGIYPLPAPLGYVDKGPGKPKTLDPERAPLVKLAFELYASGQHTLESLSDELYKRGLRNQNNQRVRKNALSLLLNNEFYIGTIHIRKTNERFPGAHEPLISHSIYSHVQQLLRGKTRHKGLKHYYPYRKLIQCSTCGRIIVPERQKGHTYYRCHNKQCRGVSVREEAIVENVTHGLSLIRLTDDEFKTFAKDYREYCELATQNRQHEKEALQLRLSNIEQRLNRLTDAYVDQMIDKETFEDRKKHVLNERIRVREALRSVDKGTEIEQRLRIVFELQKSLRDKDKLANDLEKRDLIKSVSSNLELRRKNLAITWQSPFEVFENRHFAFDDPPSRNAGRTVCETSNQGETLKSIKSRGLFKRVLNALRSS